MQDGSVAHRYFIPYGERVTRIRMQHAAVLDVAAFPDLDVGPIPADDRAEPDGTVLLQGHIPRNDRVLRHERGLFDIRRFAVIC